MRTRTVETSSAADIVVTSTYTSNDTISVRAAKNQSGIFSKILGINSANIKADAKARVDSPQQARYVAPMVVYCDHSLIQNCNGNHTPTFGRRDDDELRPDGRAGSLRHAQPRQRQRNSGLQRRGRLDPPRASTSTSPLGKYRSDPGAKFSSQNVNGALDARVGTVLLFPVFKTLDGTGQNAQYEIIGWIGFSPDEGDQRTATTQHSTGLFHRIHRPGNPRLERLRQPRTPLESNRVQLIG